MAEASKMGDFKAGDRVRIVAEIGGHQYPDGAVVTLTGQRDETGEGILAQEQDDWGIRWYVLPEEIEHENADPRIAEAERRGAVKALREAAESELLYDLDRAALLSRADSIEQGAEL